MQSLKRQSFLERAEDKLAGIRASLLMFARGRLSPGDLLQAHRRLDELATEARTSGFADASRLAVDCSDSLERLAAVDSPNRDAHVNRSLDLLSRLEAEILQMPLGSDDFHNDVSDLVDTSFEHFKNNAPANANAAAEPETVLSRQPTDADFEVDDETLDIFRSEAEGLLANIASNLNTLRSSPDDSNALWEIRRNAHTFKGAAGIIGFREASNLAHRIEDLLDKMVESRWGADARVIELLLLSTARLDDMTAGKHVGDDVRSMASLYADFETLIASVPSSSETTKAPDAVPENPAATPVETPAAPKPIVRVSLDRIDDLLAVSRNLLANRAELADRFAEVKNGADSIHELGQLIETQERLSAEILQMLMQIRMVRFGTLEMRLNRAVHVTCQEENKKASVVIVNPDTEIDTQVIDALIEPMLHLLKNAVVHGIEPPDTRRLLGKAEKGNICITVNADKTDVYLSVEDDGRGISGSKLIEKAVASGIIAAEKAATLDEQSIYNLIFNRGLTTAESLNLNAGRGVGMSIVKESVESHGGTVRIESEQQKGTKFTLRMPLTLPKRDAAQPVPEPEEIDTLETLLMTAAEIQPLMLIVDDSRSIRRMTAKIVEEAGFRTITAEDGAEALELLLSGKWTPDLILSDVEMPVMDGWEFLEYVKTDPNFGHIPVIMVTSLDSPHYRQKAFGLGASDYLIKPFSLAELDRALEDLGKLVAA